MDNLTIKINGKDYPLLVSAHACFNAAANSKKKMSSADSTLELVWDCLESGCLEKNVKLGIEKKDLLKVVHINEFNRVVPLLTSSAEVEKKT